MREGSSQAVIYATGAWIRNILHGGELDADARQIRVIGFGPGQHDLPFGRVRLHIRYLAWRGYIAATGDILNRLPGINSGLIGEFGIVGVNVLPPVGPHLQRIRRNRTGSARSECRDKVIAIRLNALVAHCVPHFSVYAVFGNAQGLYCPDDGGIRYHRGPIQPAGIILQAMVGPTYLIARVAIALVDVAGEIINIVAKPAKVSPCPVFIVGGAIAILGTGRSHDHFDIASVAAAD